MTERVRRIDQIGEESRQRILDAAEALFAEKGFHRTSFVEVAEASGISRGSIPWHFTNKDGLLLAVVQRMIARHFGHARTEDELAARSIDDIVADFDRLVRQPHGEVLLLILPEALGSTGPAHEQYLQYFQQRRASWTAWLSAQPGFSGWPLEEREAAAAVLHGVALGIQLQWQIDPDDVDLGRCLEWMRRTCAALLDAAPPRVRRRRTG